MHYYRYEDGHVWGDGGSSAPKLLEFPVVEETNATVVILTGFDTRKRVFKYAAKSFAYPTPERALASYVRRKEWHIVHAAAAHDRATWNLAAAKAMQAGEVVKDLERWRNPLFGAGNGGPVAV
jgi:hypothetical protein